MFYQISQATYLNEHWTIFGDSLYQKLLIVANI